MWEGGIAVVVVVCRQGRVAVVSGKQQQQWWMGRKVGKQQGKGDCGGGGSGSGSSRGVAGSGGEVAVVVGRGKVEAGQYHGTCAGALRLGPAGILGGVEGAQSLGSS